MLFNLDFASNTILICFFFLIIHLYFLISAVIAQIFNPIAQLIISIETPSIEAKGELERHVVAAKAKESVQYSLESYKSFALLTHQFFLVYLFNEIISCFFYIF